MILTSVVVDVGLGINLSGSMAATMPRMLMSNNFLTMDAAGGLTLGGTPTIFTHNVKLEYTTQGGVVFDGATTMRYGGHMTFFGNGGLAISAPPLVLSYSNAYVSSGGLKVGGSFDLQTDSPLILGTIATTLPLIKASIGVVANNSARISTTLPLITVAAKGGRYSIDTKLPVIKAVISGKSGVVAKITTRLPTVDAALVSKSGYIASIKAQLTKPTAKLSGFAGVIGKINSSFRTIETELEGILGTSGSVSASLPLVLAEIEAGFGAIGSINAKLTHITSAISVLAGATSGELTLVMGTYNNVLSTYDNFSYDSFFELDGVYYGVGPNGVSRLETDTGLDGTEKIPAGLSTGLMQFGESHLKRITDAYMTLRTAGDLTLTITVDEGVPVILTMPSQQLLNLIQRRVVVPKGLFGKSWKFEINNVDGADFDFGHIGFNVAVSARRIGR